MKINADSPPDFDRLARLYRWMEWASFGPLLGWCRCAFLGRLRGRRRALILGDGDGRFTARLLETNSAVRIDAVDASTAMLRTLLRRAGSHAARVRTIHADIRRFSPDQAESDPPYDLIVTHFLLDCLSTGEIRSLAERVRASAAGDAVWVVSEFAVPEGRMGHWVARPVVGGLYWAFGRLTGLRQSRLPDHARALRAEGFELAGRRTWLGGLLVSEWWQLRDARA